MRYINKLNMMQGMSTMIITTMIVVLKRFIFARWTPRSNKKVRALALNAGWG